MRKKYFLDIKVYNRGKTIYWKVGITKHRSTQQQKSFHALWVEITNRQNKLYFPLIIFSGSLWRNFFRRTCTRKSIRTFSSHLVIPRASCSISTLQQLLMFFTFSLSLSPFRKFSLFIPRTFPAHARFLGPCAYREPRQTIARLFELYNACSFTTRRKFRASIFSRNRCTPCLSANATFSSCKIDAIVPWRVTIAIARETLHLKNWDFNILENKFESKRLMIEYQCFK